MSINGTIWERASGEIRDPDGLVIARVVEGDVMSVGEGFEKGQAVCVVRCGAHAAVDPDPSAALLSQWSLESWEPFNEAVETMLGRAVDFGTQMVILPGAGGRLSDAICTVSWGVSHPDAPLLLDPVGWLTPSMMRDVGDHLIRFASLCRELPSVWGVVVRSVAMDDSGVLVPAPIGEGLIDREMLERTIGTLASDLGSALRIELR